MTNQEQKLITLAQKGGNDATLYLLDLIEELEKKMTDIEQKTPKDGLDLSYILDTIRSTKDTIKAIPVIKGDKGDKGDRGEQGKAGMDGERGTDGTDGKDGRNGRDGKDGLPGKDGVSGNPTTIFGGKKQRVWIQDLSSQLDGVLKTFTLGTHYGIISVQSSSAPFGAFRETIDYNEVGRTIVFTSSVDAAISLATGQSLIIKVLK